MKLYITLEQHDIFREYEHLEPKDLWANHFKLAPIMWDRAEKVEYLSPEGEIFVLKDRNGPRTRDLFPNRRIIPRKPDVPLS